MRTYLKVFAVLLVGCLVAGAAWFAYKNHETPTELTVAVGPTGGDDHSLITAFARRVTEIRPRMRLTVRTVKGPAEAAEAFEQGAADLAVIRADLPVPGSARALAILQKHAVLVIANETPRIKIEGFGDLKGRKLGVLGAPGANDRLIDRLMTHAGLAKSEVARVPLTREEVVDALRLRRVDAILVTMPLQGSTIQAFNAAAGRALKAAPNFVELDAEGIARTHNDYEADDIPEGAFRSAPAVPKEDLSTLFFSHLLVGRNTVSDDVAAALVRSLFESRTALQAEVPTARFIQAAKTEKDASVPIHPGAAAYLDGSEKSFFDRYGDALFYGSMFMSLLGTVTLAGYRALTQGGSAAAPDRVARMWTIAKEVQNGAVTELDRHEEALFAEFDGVVQDFARRRINDAEMTAAAAVFSHTVALVRDRRQRFGKPASAPLPVESAIVAPKLDLAAGAAHAGSGPA